MRNRIIVAALAIALAPLAALAEDEAVPTAQLRAFVGYRTFAQKAARDLAKGGPAYGVALDLGLGPWAALEGAWVGSSFGERGALVIGNQSMRQDDVWATLKLGPRYGTVEPYAFGGAGWSWIRDTAGNPYLRDRSYLTLPVGAGFDVALAPNVTLGARAAYQFGFGKDIYTAAALNPSNRTDEFVVMGSLGARF